MFISTKTFLLILALMMVYLTQCVRTSPTFPGAEEVAEEVRTCKIEVKTTVTHEGKCIRLRGQIPACASDGYLDVKTDECN
ncbi:unnamed protein product [Bursaphelenchus xylophilus]|uniref:(pine wood nematode) hypothetical protein n=1 Tax=Bursaphelenchus xylophilus TaxID=6326 RepID=A0A1I7S013_BURXY|nr:unnamed protein product [Bursaphelenchus xylophilus]CAG9109092.1 unnamed protein product [Bursaphelenchus xylophilus]